MKKTLEERNFPPENVTYFLPHLSSQFFASRIVNELELMGVNIPSSKWFTNLSWVGNVGAASPYLMLEELFHSGKLKIGDKLLMGIPESARFNYAYALLTVV
jgi:3-oxoacyl-[acyl-carrier-protein] synthase-3